MTPHQVPTRRLALFAGSAIALMLSLGLALPQAEVVAPDEETEWPVTGGAAPGYVPDSACAECHEERFHSFQDSPMSRSFYRMGAGKIPDDLADSAFFHEASGNHYEIVEREGEFFQRRWKVDARGERYAEFEQRIDWIMGSGAHAQTFCFQTPSGELFQMPLGWYRGPGFGMSPGFDTENHEGFRRPITRRCMFCHNAFGETPEGADQHGELLRFAPETLPSGINCQRCHGPGAKHALLALDPETDDEVLRDAIVHPAQVGIERANSICFQCHLQPSAALNDTVRRLGRGSLSFRPGEDLRDYTTHFDFADDGSGEESFEINHHAYRLRQSKCFTESGGTMGCISCHSPHNRPTVEERPEYYRWKCLNCHQAEHCSSERRLDESTGMANDCAGCHMPERRAQDVVLATATDHLIRRDPAPASFLEPLMEDHEPLEAEPVFYFDETGLNESEQLLAQALFRVRSGDIHALSILAQAVDRLEPETAEPLIDLGYGYLQAAEFERAGQTFEELTERFPERAIGWRNRSKAALRAGRDAEAVRTARKAVELEPGHPDNHFALARALGSERLKPALASFRAGLLLRPHDDRALFDMAELLLERGRFQQAAAKLELAVAAAPRSLENYRRLGDARHELGEPGAALAAWSRGLARAEYDADLLRKLAIGLLTARDEELRDVARALEVANTAVLVTPRDPDAVTALALARLEAGELDEALETLARAEELRADRVVTGGLRALLHEARGRADEARDARRSALDRTTRRDPAGALRAYVLERLNSAGQDRER